MTKLIALSIIALALTGCSAAALMENGRLDTRLQSLEKRVNDLEIKQAAAHP